MKTIKTLYSYETESLNLTKEDQIEQAFEENKIPRDSAFHLIMKRPISRKEKENEVIFSDIVH